MFIPPQGYNRIKTVCSFEELLGTEFGPKVNALCWSRQLDGDFDALAACFKQETDIVSLDEDGIDALRSRLSPAGLRAAQVMLEDLKLLRARDLLPSIECVPTYPRDEAGSIIPTDVYSFHADRAPVRTDTYLCSYNEACSEGLRNEDAQRRVDVPETRAALHDLFLQEDGDNFDLWLEENCFDLHYAPRPNATPFSFGIGNLWRIAVEYPGSPVPPCVHRAPDTVPGRLPRLLLIS